MFCSIKCFRLLVLTPCPVGPRSEKVIGSARIYLESLAMQIENELDAKIMSTEGRPSGTLRTEVGDL